MLKTANVITDALSQALETMAFMTALPLDDDIPPPGKTIAADIKFSGPKNGSLKILAGIEFAEILADNIAAVEQPDTQTCCDAMKELANVTCGLLLPAVANSNADVFNVSVPNAQLPKEPQTWHQFTKTKDNVVLNIEGNLVAASLKILEEPV